MRKRNIQHRYKITIWQKIKLGYCTHDSLVSADVYKKILVNNLQISNKIKIGTTDHYISPGNIIQNLNGEMYCRVKESNICAFNYHKEEDFSPLVDNFLKPYLDDGWFLDFSSVRFDDRWEGFGTTHIKKQAMEIFKEKFFISKNVPTR